MPNINRQPILFDYSDDLYAALVKRHHCTDKNKDTFKSSIILSTRLTLAVQFEDAGPLTPDTVVGHGPEDHSGKSYEMEVTKTGCTIMRT